MPRTRQEADPPAREALPRYGWGSQHSLIVLARERDSHYRIAEAHRAFEAAEAERVAALCARMENQQKK